MFVVAVAAAVVGVVVVLLPELLSVALGGGTFS